MAHADLLRPLPFPPGPMGPGWNVSSCTQSPTRNASFCVSGAGLGSAGGAAVGAASAAGLAAGAGAGACAWAREGTDDTSVSRIRFFMVRSSGQAGGLEDHAR